MAARFRVVLVPEVGPADAAPFVRPDAVAPVPDDGPAWSALRPLAAASFGELAGFSLVAAFLLAVAADFGPAVACARSSSPSATVITWWPPNWPRSAATACSVGELCWREAKRANSEAEITGIGTESAIASSTVHRPSPESTV